MTRPIEAITNAETGETVYQEMSDESYAIYAADKARDEELLKEKAIADKNTAEAKAALLVKLGISADEAKLLLN